MAKMNGIDVSKHQGSINWSSVKLDGVEFAIIRAGYGREMSQKDQQFENNYAGCKSNSIPCGVYWYSYAMSPDDARKEAAVCLEVIKGKTFEFPIYFDIEEKKQLALGKDKCTAIAKAFLEEVESNGYWVGIYSSKSHLENYIDEDVRNRYAVWVAHYGVKKTTYSGQFGIWQKSSTGKINGISGNVDLNECYIDYPTAMKNAGLNGYKKSDKKTEQKKEENKTETSKPKTEVTVSYRNYAVKKGDTLWDIAKKYLGYGTRYKEIMKANNLTSDRIYAGQILKVPKS